jgi:hypothetical protein
VQTHVRSRIRDNTPTLQITYGQFEASHVILIPNQLPIMMLFVLLTKELSFHTSLSCKCSGADSGGAEGWQRAGAGAGLRGFDAFPKLDDHFVGQKGDTKSKPSLNNTFPMRRPQPLSSPKRLSSMQVILFLLQTKHRQIIRPKSLCTTALDGDT